eukprot:TRINITY_DN10454_c0_g1_i1.p2 TRINITY_DN10454_c0_g1~~TRINITY_DN10454_c0_g1_i1.p2  ORF type:complete len:332 (+),score=105.14 TRINITY_DN10454_c0_g1_i1:69-1064(+)
MQALEGVGEGSGWFHWTYVVDWVGTIAVGAAIYFPLKDAMPRCRDFDPLDPAINHAYAESEAFPNWSLPLVAGLVPIVYGLCVIGYFAWARGRLSAGGRARQPAPATVGHQVHTLVLAVFQALVFAMLITNPLKQYVGRQRPDFVDRLEREIGFDKHAYNVTDPESRAAMMQAVCSAHSHKVFDGMRSFPSGHASYSFAGWAVVALLLLPNVPWRARGFPTVPALFLALSPAVLPTMVAASRTVDNRHNYADILAGALLGVFAGAVVFALHYRFGSPDPLNRRTGQNESATELCELTGDDAQVGTKASFPPHELAGRGPSDMNASYTTPEP